PAQSVSLPREPLDHVQLEAVKVAGFVKPALVRKANRIDDERITFPMADRITLPGLLGHARLVVRAAVRRNHPKSVLSSKSARVQEDDLILRLHNLRGSAHARHAVGPALEFGIKLIAVGIVFPDFGPEFRLVERLVAIAQAAQRVVVLEILEA